MQPGESTHVAARCSTLLRSPTRVALSASNTFNLAAGSKSWRSTSSSAGSIAEHAYTPLHTKRERLQVTEGKPC